MLAERGGKLGFNLKLVLETSEERGSTGLREFVAAHADELAADVLIASDGPRVMPEVPTIATGTRGTYHFDLVVDLRPGGVHSGHWGGLTTDPAVVLTHALGAIIDRQRQNPGARLAAAQRRAGERARGAGRLPGRRRRRGRHRSIPDWGEPGLTPAEKIYGWNSFIVLAMLSGRPENPVNAVAPNARAHCQIRYTVDTDPAGFEAGAAQAPRRRRLHQRPHRERRRPHAREPHRSRRSLGPLDRRQHGAVAGQAGAGHPELLRRPCRAMCSSITSARRWSGFRTATTAASSTARTSTS